MRVHVPTWLKAGAALLAALAVATIATARSQRAKNWLIGQFAAPHGVVGWAIAQTMAHPNKLFRDVHNTASELLDLQPDDRLIDVSCGPGVFLDTHAAHVHHVAGIDSSVINVKLARQRLGDRIAADAAQIIHANPANLPLHTASFTAATSSANLVVYPNPDAVLDEMYRVLQPGGRVVVPYGIDNNDEACVKEIEFWGIKPPTEEEARKAIETAGFSLVSITYIEEGYLNRFITGTKPA